MNYVVVLNDGETYGEATGAVTMVIPEHIEDVDTYIRERFPMEEPVVPMSELLDSVVLAMQGLGLSHHTDDVLATVEDYVVNNWGED